jgi:hypothetical protein
MCYLILSKYIQYSKIELVNIEAILVLNLKLKRMKIL